LVRNVPAAFIPISFNLFIITLDTHSAASVKRREGEANGLSLTAVLLGYRVPNTAPWVSDSQVPTAAVVMMPTRLDYVFPLAVGGERTGFGYLICFLGICQDLLTNSKILHSSKKIKGIHHIFLKKLHLFFLIFHAAWHGNDRNRPWGLSGIKILSKDYEQGQNI
jgi:hypothetical protein